SGGGKEAAETFNRVESHPRPDA
nr:RecName: Full=Alpha-amylase inhibitor DR4 [Delonix regia]